ncbi:MAG TPA: response regulator [Gemmatimonadaceae bacterium]|nr:response regulator [Gemmatimonadaceae bacterium]
MSKRILVVDDDRGMVSTLCDILELHGWETERAYDGTAAVELSAARAVDVVLMDVRMPQMDGVDALRLIKRARPATRVVLMTAYARQELLAQAERDGAVSILKKPVEVSALLPLLDEAAARAHAVLVVDDDPGYLRTLADMLRTHGVATVEAPTLDDALTQLERETPGAVLLDLKLDDLDPHEAILAIKEMSPSVLLILYSGHGAALHDAVTHAPQGYIAAAFTKPLSVDALLDALHVQHGH